MQAALKTRLIGATVLVALAVIIVPLFFPPAPVGGSGDDAAMMAIPDAPDDKLQTRIIHLTPQPGQTTTPATGDDAGATAATSSTGAATTSTAKQPPADAKADKPAVTQSTPDAAAAGPKVADSGWAVQLIAYSRQSSAEKFKARVQKAGYHAFIDNVKSGSKVYWRVRVGPKASRDEATTLQKRLKGVFPKLESRIVEVQ